MHLFLNATHLRRVFALLGTSYALCSITGAQDFFSSSTCDPWHEPNPYDMPNPNIGHTVEAPGSPGCPRGMVRVENFCIDRYEASLVEIHRGRRETPWSPYHNPDGHRVRAVSVAGAVPQGYVSGRDAKAACEASGKRLCTDADWLRACEGATGRSFPYGETRYPGGSSSTDPFCNEARSVHPAIELFGDKDPFDHLENSCINQLAHGLARSGAYSRCESEEGVFDLMGNLHEWTADADGTFRGGFYVDTQANGEGCHYVTTKHSFRYWDYSTGFRCCTTPSLR